MTTTTPGRPLPPATTGRKVTVYEVSTGAAIERWPVDARELVATGEYSTTPHPVPDDSTDAPAPVPAAVPSPAPDMPREAIEPAAATPAGETVEEAPAPRRRRSGRRAS